MTVKYTKHLKEMLLLRNLDVSLVEQCVENPDQILPAREDKKIYIKDFGKNYLKLVIAEEGKNKVIITAHWLDKKRLKK